MTKSRPSRRGVSPPRKPNQIDAQVGRRLRAERVALGLSQEELGKRLGLTFQQVQKYELGRNRVSASRLHQLSELLGVPINSFFEEVGQPAKALPPAGQDAFPASDRSDHRELLELMRTYRQIGTPGLRRQLQAIARIFANGDGSERTEPPPDRD